MDAAEFGDALVRLGLSQAAAARMLKVSRRSVVGWANGTQPVPGPVEVALSALVLVNEGEAQIATLRLMLARDDEAKRARPKRNRPTKAQLRRRADLAAWQWARFPQETQ